MISWETLRSELAKIPLAKDREAAWLAHKLGIGIQAVHNWSERGVPPKQAPALAKILQWSVARVMGAEDPPSHWPLRRITRQRWEALDDWDKGAIEEAALRKIEEIEAQRQAVKLRTGTNP
jgi:hypothetical protein